MKNFFLLSILAWWMTAASCLGELDIKPTDIKDQDVAFETVTDVNTGVLGVYAGLGTSTLGISSLLADENMLSAENIGNRGVLAFSWRQDPVNPDVIVAWQSFYQVLDRANRILDVIDEVPYTMTDAGWHSQLKGELLALRAFCHFELLRHYAVDYEPASPGIPVMTSSSIGKPARDAVQRVYQQINEDLAEARNLIPASFNDLDRVTRTAVIAMQARAALYQKSWDAAIAAATDVINAVPLATAAQFPDIWTDKGTAEVIWKLKREAQDARFGEFFRDGAGRITYAPSFKLLATFDAANDVRFNAYIRDLAPAAPARRWSVGKYTGGQPAFANLADIKLFRASEMYLVRAEAYAFKGELDKGTDDLNDLRAMRIAGYADVSFANTDLLNAAVQEERFKELAFEGHRYYDLRRRKADIVRLPEDVAQVTDPRTKLTPDDQAYYLPIPLKETQANENIKQHPKYE
ncbi:RagB/SusD family nutrient uptake outer membrane protein [Chitinophaga sp. GCM10012297]|uniref:RagB/SusD family nutrient uptake outer membrane protein n=1 Tax=Chitinophaga chungangae TaxID=2821488 RepID=A0ABS3YDA0_9BACT|nr:RagB/SusD family nutrient uptake outer membrane protein [Chitinophaga chungangae]MBO9152643.1 RagB/SusD family nutrient uptake outer membrane protein [Chitinophaga chungangae]